MSVPFRSATAPARSRRGDWEHETGPWKGIASRTGEQALNVTARRGPGRITAAMDQGE